MSSENLPAVRAPAPPPALSPERPIGKLAEALAEAQKRCRPVEKDGRIRSNKLNFRYAKTEDILTEAGQALLDTGLSVVMHSPQLKVLGNGNTAVFFLTRNVTLVHSSGEYMSLGALEWPVNLDSGQELSKAFCSAITLSYGYVLRDLLRMPRVDPEDDRAAQEAGVDTDDARNARGQSPGAVVTPPPRQDSAPAAGNGVPPETVQHPISYIGEKQLEELKRLIAASKSDAAKLVDHFKVPVLQKLLETQYWTAREMLLQKIDKAKAAATENVTVPS